MRIASSRVAALAAVTGAITAPLAVSGFAQSDTGQFVSSYAVVGLASGRTGTDVVRVYLGEQILSAQDAVLPANMTFPETHRHLLESMLQHSATFRRQCVRIAQSPRVRIAITTLPLHGSETTRARGSLQVSRDGVLVATLAIRPLDDQAELIAHELEHVIEKLDGVHLHARASLRATGVRVAEDGAFETVRAVRVGRAVSREVQKSGS